VCILCDAKRIVSTVLNMMVHCVLFRFQMAACPKEGSVLLCTTLHGTHDCNWSVCEICLGCIADMFEDDEFSLVSLRYFTSSLICTQLLYFHSTAELSHFTNTFRDYFCFFTVYFDE